MIDLLSANLVNSVKPKNRVFEVRDTRVKGFILRVQPSGSKSYYVELGHGKRKRIGPASAFQPDEARTEARRLISDFHKDDGPSGTKSLKPIGTLGNYIDKVYEPWAIASLKTGKSTTDRIRHSFADLVKMPLTSICIDAVETWRTRRLRKGIKKSTLNRELNDLKAALNRAVERGYLRENPIKGMKPFKIDRNGNPNFLTSEELVQLRKSMDRREERIKEERRSGNAWRAKRGKALMRSLDKFAFADHLKPMVLLALNTGLRRGEMFSLDWRDIDFERLMVTVKGSEAKSGKTRHIPLNKEAAGALTGWRKQSKNRTGLVFKGENGKRFDNVRKSWAGVLKEANIGKCRWHDLRHTFASHLVMKGVDLNTVRELLGHSDYKMTLRYAHLAPEHKAAAVEKLVWL